LPRLSQIAVDVRPLRESRDFRLLTAGSLITGLGTQATLVALPYQVFVLTGSAFLTGLLGAAEIVPLAAGSLYGGALADRFDRRRMLLACQLALVGVGGLLIAGFGIAVPYGVDAVSCLGMAAAAAAMSPQPPHAVEEHEPVGQSIRSGLRFVRGLKALMGSFVIDLSAMTFGMPRALFAILSLTVYGAGAAGTGLLYAAVAFGSTVAALTTGWLIHARYLGRIVLAAVALWGAFIAAAGLVNSIWPAAALFALAGAADSVSAVCRSTISQTLTPDRMRGRMTSVFSLVVAGGPRLGDIESGTVAALTSPTFSVVSGGLVCLTSVGLIAAAFPELATYDGDAIGAGEVGAADLELAAERTEATELG
jgi:MFS family permease